MSQIVVKVNDKEKTLSLVKRIVYLAWQACGGPIGSGIFQDARLRGNQPTEEQVWKCAVGHEDYGGFGNENENEIYCDYVFGRMMKWGCKWDEKQICIRDMTFRSDYQGFSSKYKNNNSLICEAIKSLGLENVEINKND